MNEKLMYTKYKTGTNNRTNKADPHDDRKSPPIAKVGVLLRSETQKVILTV